MNVNQLNKTIELETTELRAKIERLRAALKIVVDSGENSARTASHKYADVVIAGAAYEAARAALK